MRERLMTEYTFIRLTKILEITGVSPSTLWRWEKSGHFPKRIQIGPNSVAWLESDVVSWMEDRVKESITSGGGQQ